MEQYLDLLENIYRNGEDRSDRTGVGTRSLFGVKKEYDLQYGFPLLTTKRVWFRGVKAELLWFLSGSSNAFDLPNDVQKIWDKWCDEDGSLGPVYGTQWRQWGESDKDVDQIKEVINSIKSNPYSRRHLISAWNVGDLDSMNLPPCHVMFQFYVREDEFLDCQLTQRSCDTFIGCPFNIASYSLLTHMIAHITGYKPGKFIHSIGDAHIYKNHFEQVETQLERSPRQLPELNVNKDINNIDDFEMEDLEIEGYNPYPHIEAPIAV